LLLALVVALGALGVGYAMWSDTITIDGTVNTGTVDITVDNYSATYVYKIVDTHGTVISATPLPTSKNNLLVASAVATSAGDDAVTLTYDNLFPIFDANGEPAAFCADFAGTYVGTIPVHIYAEISTKDAWLEDLWEAGYVGIKYQVWDAAGSPITFPDCVIQLHEGDKYEVALCITIPQDDNDGTTTQEWLSGQSGSFTAKIVAYQWNETYTPPVSAP